MLSLLLLLTGLGRLASADHRSETARLQITVPQKTETNNKDGSVSETHVTYSIQIDKKMYTLTLEKQSFLDSHFLVYSYNKSGRMLLPDSSFIKGHCFYQGYAAEILNSVVTLSTCSGLRGLLQLENVSYGIEPLEYSTTFEHMVYQIKGNTTDISPTAEYYSTTQLANQSYKILVKSEEYSNVLSKRILKIQVIMDKALFDYMGSEVPLASEKVFYIFSLINTMYSQLKVSVMLTSLEIWSDLNKISTNGDANEVLQRFVSWREKFLFQRSHDMAYLLIYRDHPNYVGATYHAMACDPKFAAGLALYPNVITLEGFSVLFAQLLGINLGLTYHKDIYNCYCPGATCIMNPKAIRSHGVKFFSSCSIDEFKHIVSQPEFECLQNRTVSKVVPQGRTAVCGNSVLEPPEQCDCGTIQNCTFKKCCNPLNCHLIGPAKCGTGPCCNQKICKVYERRHVCRKSTDLCDFAEFCDGTSEFCVPDVKAADLELCIAKGASALYSQQVNMHTDEFGSCHGKFCNYENIFCGKVVCHWTRSEVVPFKNFDTQYTFLDGLVCVSAHLRSNTQTNIKEDMTCISTGTMCGPQQYCQGSTCRIVPSERVDMTCNSTINCSGHGICNNLQNCHCDAGYAPPNCKKEPLSPGGSINDGFWSTKVKNRDFLIEQHGASRKNGLMISFYVFLPFLIVGAIIAFKRNKSKIFQNREDTVCEESLSEVSSSNSTQSS